MGVQFAAGVFVRRARLGAQLGPDRFAGSGLGHAPLAGQRFYQHEAEPRLVKPGGRAGVRRPRVSVAYSNSDGPMDPYIKALDPPLAPVSVDISDVQLIVLGRDTHLYEWQTRAVVPLALEVFK